jgi:zinc/manganese transport system permease protein
VGSIVAVVAGLVGFFVVMRGSAFAAHAIPNGSFAGAAGAALVGANTLLGVGAFAVLGALAIALLGRRGRHDVATALALVAMLALGSLFLDLSSDYAAQVDSLLFGEVLGISANQVLPTLALGLACVAALAFLFRPLLLASALAEVADARGVSPAALELAFLLLLALATTVTVPVVGTLLVFSLTISAPAAARCLVDRPASALALSVALALATVWGALALSYSTDYPMGFFVGTIGAGGYALARSLAALRGVRPAEAAS